MGRSSRNKREARSHPIIDIRQSEIDNGTANDRWDCIGVQAIQRKFPDALRVRVDVEKVAFTRNGRRYFYETPPEFVDNVIRPLDEGRREDIKPMAMILVKGQSQPQEKNRTGRKKLVRDQQRERRRGEKKSPDNCASTKRLRPATEPRESLPTEAEKAVIFRT
jgi:hypothetical protein